MQQPRITQRIKTKALELLDNHPEGLRFSDLHKAIRDSDPTFNANTVSGSIWDLEVTYPKEVYKPSKGIFQLLKYRAQETENDTTSPAADTTNSKTSEKNFYLPFANWLINDIEDVTHAISLGGNKFGGKWGTPDVIGKNESKRSDIIQGPIEIVSAEIKTETAQLVTAFGQACAYKLFSHKVYLVVPKKSPSEEISRLDALCQIFGIGLVLFNADDPESPDFRLNVRPSRHEPDLYYTNANLAKIEDLLFPKTNQPVMD